MAYTTSDIAAFDADWMTRAAARLRDAQACPRCTAALTDGHCPICRADYRGAAGADLRRALLIAAAALEDCRSAVARVPLVRDPAPAPAPAATPVTEPAAVASRSSATVQSVLAVAGAGLVAIAALVFTFFTPDLRDPLGRGMIVAAVTVIFLLGARWLARRGLQFSAEAVGALALVFLALDVHTLTGLAPGVPWTIAAGATAVVSAVMIAAAVRTGLRVWLWASLPALAVVPSMFGIAADQPAVGHFGSAAAAFALLTAVPGLGSRFGASLRPEAVTLTVVQLAALATALLQGSLFGAFPTDAAWPWLCGMLAASAVLALLSTRNPASGLWSVLAGGFGVAAFLALPMAVAGTRLADATIPAVLPTASVIGAIVIICALPAPATVRRTALAAGALGVVFAMTLPLAMLALLIGAQTSLARFTAAGDTTTAEVVVGLTSTALGLVLIGRLARHAGLGWVTVVGAWIGVFAALSLLSVPDIALLTRVALGVGVGAGVAVLVAGVGRLRVAPLAVRVPLVVGAHLLVALAALLSWHDAHLAVAGGVAVVASTGALAMTVPTGIRCVHLGAGYAYALVVFASALSLVGVGGVALLCLTTAAGAIAAIAATFTQRVTVRSWYAVLVVTTVPFLLGIVQVIFERSGWTALSTGLIFLLALALIVTRRAGLGIAVRVTAALALVPSLAVVVVCLGAQLLPGSGSPVVLPMIAVIVAVVLPTGALAQAALARRTGERDAAFVRLTIEASTLVTAGIAVLLALVRDAAGLRTTILVLVLLAVGGAATSVWGRRPYGWVLAAAAGTGALWCAWALAGITVAEPYLLPPSVGAAVVGLVLTVRGSRGLPLYAAGLLLAVVPLVVLTAVAGSAPRALGVVAASWMLVIAQVLLARAGSRLEALRPVTGVAAIIAGSAGAVLGVRLGLGLEESALAVPTVLACLMVASAGAAPAAIAAALVRRASAARIAHSVLDARAETERPAIPPTLGWQPAASRWMYAPVVAYLTVGTWAGIRHDSFAIWTMWALLLAELVLLVVAARREVRGRPGLPPVWFLFVLAFLTAVVAWSPRELRVEWFSLPLGMAVLIAGSLALPGSTGARRGAFAAWPGGWGGSWPLLGPGIVLMLSASVAATFTDPRTWRAILVIVLALVAILVGAARRWAAPFLLGIITLPMENAIAFLVQIGRGIDSMPWWITLAVVGAVLLIIAVTYERREGEHSGFAARLGDLA